MHTPVEKTFDVIVIGTGPGGEGASMEATKQRKRVGIIERMPQIGGACTHLGTIPSKSLRAAIYRIMDVNSAPVFRQLGVNLEVSFRDLRRSAQSIIDQQVGMRRSFYDRNDVEVLRVTPVFSTQIACMCNIRMAAPR
ncbi:MAG: FAD-dependent oxidoreductase [Planctomycetaceae bacterium]